MMDLSQFYVKHSKGGSGHEPLTPIYWKTCLREIYFGIKPVATEAQDNDFEYYEGAEAYKFLLQVVCGLKSPMIGETEVFGQFKNYIDSFSVYNSDSSEVKKILIDIRNSSKKIRSAHLINLGAQSYGSLLRKKINFAEDIHIIGAGQFVEDIAPWISKRSQEIYIHSRNPDKSKNKKALIELKHKDLHSGFNKTGTLIIAAPLTGEEIITWMGQSKTTAIFDLRGSSKNDPIKTDIPVVNLHEFFNQIENNKSKIEQKVNQANAMIDSLTETKVKGQKLNPFGWDDICA